MRFTVIFHNHTNTSIGRLITEHGNFKTVVEIGVFEGETTFHLARFLNHQDGYKHYAIDPFKASENLKQEVVDRAREIFLENQKEFPCVELIEKPSFDGLIELHNRKIRPDFIYVDGSHFAKDVLIDAALGFELLAPGGIMLFDDAVNWRYGDKIQDSPKIAIDSFIQCNWDRLDILEVPNGYQIAIKKRG